MGLLLLRFKKAECSSIFSHTQRKNFLFCWLWLNLSQRIPIARNQTGLNCNLALFQSTMNPKGTVDQIVPLQGQEQQYQCTQHTSNICEEQNKPLRKEVAEQMHYLREATRCVSKWAGNVYWGIENSITWKSTIILDSLLHCGLPSCQNFSPVAEISRMHLVFFPWQQLLTVKQKSVTVRTDNNEQQLFASILERPPPEELLTGPWHKWRWRDRGS